MRWRKESLSGPLRARFESKWEPKTRLERKPPRRRNPDIVKDFRKYFHHAPRVIRSNRPNLGVTSNLINSRFVLIWWFINQSKVWYFGRQKCCGGISPAEVCARNSRRTDSRQDYHRSIKFTQPHESIWNDNGALILIWIHPQSNWLLSGAQKRINNKKLGDHLLNLTLGNLYSWPCVCSEELLSHQPPTLRLLRPNLHSIWPTHSTLFRLSALQQHVFHSQNCCSCRCPCFHIFW